MLVTEDNVLLKLLAAEVRGTPVAEVGHAPFRDLVYGSLNSRVTPAWLRLNGEWGPRLESFREEFSALEERGRLTVRDPETGRPLHRLIHPPADAAAGGADRSLVVAGAGRMSVFNRVRFPEDGPLIVCEPLTGLRNFAAFCDATGARQHYLALMEPENIALHMMEGDALFRKRTMAGTGRAIVLDVLNPSPRVRVLVEHTASFKADPRERAVAPLEVIGDRRVTLGACGSGAARLVSPPLAPQASGPAHLLVVNFGDETVMNPNHLSGLETLWGTDLPRDRRRLTGHVRDISVLSEEEYAAFKPPEAVRNFPADLTNPHLEYSGFFEEGWVGTEAKVRLTQGGPDRECVIRGHVPGLPGAEGFRTELTVLIDGVAAHRQELKPGDFEARVPGGSGAGPRWVELHFTRAQVLPSPDGRLAAAHIRSIGFEPRDEALSRPPQKLAAFPADLNHPRLEQSGIWADGWAGPSFRANLTQVAAGELVFRGHIPGAAGDGSFRTELVLLLDGREVARQALTAGDFEARAPAGKTAQARRVECRFTTTQVLPAPDGRRVGAHIRFLGFEPARQDR